MKKFLSLVLTLAMALSMMMFAAPVAGAKDFTDRSSITNDKMREAADVISAIEVMDGYSDNSFRPQGTLTRQAAAKIICNLVLGPTTAKALPTTQNPFPDVPAGGEFSGYISYCADKGIINGYADGTFRPGDPLSGYAYLKMLLGALGFDAQIEQYVGANWRVNVAKQALGIGLADGLDAELDATRTVTREEASLYAFNMLQADLVSYGSKVSVTTNGGETVTVGSQQASAQEWPRNSSTRVNNIKADSYVQFAEQYFNKLVRTPDRTDAFGRPATRWDWKGVEIGTYHDTIAKKSNGQDAVYYGNPKVNAIFNDLNMPGDDWAEFYVNGLDYGRLNDDGDRGIDFKRGNGDELNDYTKSPFTPTGGTANVLKDGIIGDGTITEVYRDDDDNHVVICSMSYYAGKISSVRARTDKKDAYVIVETFGAAANGQRPATIMSATENREFETTSFSVDDIVGYTYSDKDEEIKSLDRLSSVRGSVSSRIRGDSVSLDGTKYSYGETYAFDSGIDESDLLNNTDVVLYRDSQGNVMFVEYADFDVVAYAAITNIETHKGSRTYTFNNPTGSNNESTSWNDDRAHLIFADGTERNVYLDDDYISGSGLETWLRQPGIVRYKVTDSGDYKLYKVSDNKQVSDDITDYSIGDNRAWFRDDDGTIYADSATIFVIQQGSDNFKVYTGQRNAPDVDDDDADVMVYFTGSTSRTAKLVFVRNAASVISTSTDVTFFSGKSASKRVDESDYSDAYREYTVVRNGRVETILVSANAVLESPATSEGSELDISGTDYDVDKAWRGAIVNEMNWDSDNELVTSGRFNNKKYDAGFAWGIKTTGNTYEIRVGTNYNGFDDDGEPNINGGNYDVGDGRLWDLASDVHVYYADGDEITAITVNDIVTDEDDFIYWTSDDGEITNLFICAYEP